MRCMSLILAAALLGTAMAGPYPTTSPVSKEAYKGTGILASTPDNLYKDDEVGGYLYTYSVLLYTMDGNTISDSDCPYAHQHNTWCRYFLVTMFGAPPVLPDSLWNCTSKDIVFKHGDYTGVINGDTICEVGDCCSFLIGNVKFSDDQLDWHQWLADFAAPAMCDAIPEWAYCILVGGDFQLNCDDFILVPDERSLIMFPCFDLILTWYLSCALFKTTFSISNKQEPSTYYDQMSNEMLMNHETMSGNQDLVCNSISYFHPEMAVTSGDGGDGGSGGGGGGSSPSGDDESSAMKAGVFAVAALLALAL